MAIHLVVLCDGCGPVGRVPSHEEMRHNPSCIFDGSEADAIADCGWVRWHDVTGFVRHYCPACAYGLREQHCEAQE